MKKIIFSIIAVSTLLVSGCGTSSYYASSGFQDGIYYRASKEDIARKEIENKEVKDLISRTRQQARTFSDTIHYAVVQPITDTAGTTYIQLTNTLEFSLPWETYPTYWDYRYPWNYYGPGYVWDPWFYGPNTPWGPSYYFGWSWDPWFYGPSWGFYWGYWGSPWDPYWDWGYHPPYYPPYPPHYHPPHHAHGGSPTGHYYGRRDNAHGGALASSSRRAVGVRGDSRGSDVRDLHATASARPKLNVVRGREVPAGVVNSDRVERGGISRNNSLTSAGTASRRDNLGENYVFRGEQGRSGSLRESQGIRREGPVKSNFRRSTQAENRQAPDLNRSSNTLRRNNSDYSWGNTVSTSRNDRNTSTYRSSGSSSHRSSGGGSVRSSGGSSGGGRVGARR